MLDILKAFKNATQYANKYAKAWHWWALFNTAVMSFYLKVPNVTAQFVAQFVVAAVTGYFHSIACAANAKGVDDSLQVNEIPGSEAFLQYEFLFRLFTEILFCTSF